MKMKKLYLLCTICLTLFTIESKAQQHYQLSQFFQNMQAFNPAFTGINNWIDIKTSYRHQWTGFDGAPETFMMSIQTPTSLISQLLYKKYSFRVSNPGIYEDLRNQAYNEVQKLRHGVGLFIVSDRQALYTNFSGVASYSIHYHFSPKLYVSGGLSASVGYFDKNEDRIFVQNPENDVLYKHFMEGGGSLYDVRLSGGILIYGKDFYAGYSSIQFVSRSPFENENSDNEVANDHHYLMGSYNFRLNDDIALSPLVLLKYSYTSPFYYYSLFKANYKDKIWAGVGYRSDKAVMNMIGMNITKQLYFSYSYDYNFSSLSDHSSGSHELVLGLTLKRHRNSFRFW